MNVSLLPVPNGQSSDQVFRQIDNLIRSSELTQNLENQRSYFIAIVTVLSLLLSAVGIFAIADRWFTSDREKTHTQLIAKTQLQAQLLEAELSAVQIHNSNLAMRQPDVTFYSRHGADVKTIEDLEAFIHESLPESMRDIHSLPLDRRERIFYDCVSAFLARSRLFSRASPADFKADRAYRAAVNALRGVTAKKDFEYIVSQTESILQKFQTEAKG